MSGPVLTTEVSYRTARRIGSGQTEESEALGASLWYMEAWSPPSAQARRDYSGAFLPQWQSKHPWVAQIPQARATRLRSTSRAR